MVRVISLDSEYEKLASWWKKRDCPPIPKEMLNDFGYMSYDGDKEICAVWFYPTIKSPICWYGFFISNIDIDSDIRDKGMDEVIDYCHAVAKKTGYKMIMTMSNSEELKSRLLKHEYALLASGSNEFLRGL